MELSSLLTPEFVTCGLKARTKEAALHEILELGARASGVPVSRLAEALAERERRGPLSVAKGTAFPHVRTDEVAELRVVLGTSPEGIDFKAPDGLRIRLLVLFLIPSRQPNAYLEALAGFLDLLGKEGVFRHLVEAKSGEDLSARVRAASSAPPPALGMTRMPEPTRPGARFPAPEVRPGPAPSPASRFGLLPRGP